LEAGEDSEKISQSEVCIKDFIIPFFPIGIETIENSYIKEIIVGDLNIESVGVDSRPFVIPFDGVSFL
jgi:hypothetical protein